ncbi:MAG TPA: glucuronate isomerase, partial [Pirellulales bacterium]
MPPIAGRGALATLDARVVSLRVPENRVLEEGLTMSEDLVARLFAELDRLVLIDPHTHINPLAPASTNLADLLGYHYYTELAHSAGLARDRIEAPGLSARDKVAVLVEHLQPLENTIQYSWLIELSQKFFGFQHEKLTPQNWESLYDAVEQRGKSPDWADQVLKASGVEAVFLTNDFDDPLAGFDTKKYIPCLRTDDLVFHLARKSVRERLARATDVDVHNSVTLRTAIGRLFEKFVRAGAKACAISLPPDFTPTQVDAVAANEAIAALYHEMPAGDLKHSRTASH